METPAKDLVQPLEGASASAPGSNVPLIVEQLPPTAPTSAEAKTSTIVSDLDAVPSGKEAMPVTAKGDSGVAVAATGIAAESGIRILGKPLHVLPGREPQKWLLGMDDQEGSEWAFNYVLNTMDKERDALVLLCVSSKKITEEQQSREILLRFALRAERLGVKNLKLWLRLGKDAGPILCQSAKDLGSNTLILGHHQQGSSKVFGRHHSVTKHCEAHSPCALSIQREKVVLLGGAQLAEIERIEDLENKLLKGSEEIGETLEKHFAVKGKTYVVEVTL